MPKVKPNGKASTLQFHTDGHIREGLPRVRRGQIAGDNERMVWVPKEEIVQGKAVRKKPHLTIIIEEEDRAELCKIMDRITNL